MNNVEIDKVKVINDYIYVDWYIPADKSKLGFTETGEFTIKITDEGKFLIDTEHMADSKHMLFVSDLLDKLKNYVIENSVIVD